MYNIKNILSIMQVSQSLFDAISTSQNFRGMESTCFPQLFSAVRRLIPRVSWIRSKRH